MEPADADSSAPVEEFRPTSGRVSGVLVQVVGAAMVVLGLADVNKEFAPWVIASFVLAMVLAWAAMLRPALRVEGETLVVRGMFDTVRVPLAGIEEFTVRQVLALRAGGKRYVSPVVGRSRKRMTLADHRPASTVQDTSPRHEKHVDYADWVTERLDELTLAARERAGVRRGSEEQLALVPVRRFDVLPVGLAAAALLVVVVLAVAF